VRKHNIPISAIPCYAYRYYSPPEAGQQPLPAPAQSCPYSSKTSFRENASPDSTTDGTVVTQPQPVAKSPVPSSSSLPVAPAPDTNITNIFPKVQIESIEETMKDTELTPDQLTNYCKKVFVFKELEVAKFKTWKERRAYFKQSQKKKIEKELINRPTLPEGTKIITIPALELSNISGADGDTALNQKVVKKTKKKWIINPVGKSTVCLLHEYVQQSLKTQPYYSFTELDNAATPYAATVRINELEYGRGTGSSKKIAKSEAARRTLEMLIPEIKDKLPSLNGDGDGDGPDLSFFDEIRVEDPRVADLCNRTSEPAPYQILVTCLQRNYGLGDTHTIA
jgi:microprocessor complex subunit DGCR8